MHRAPSCVVCLSLFLHLLKPNLVSDLCLHLDTAGSFIPLDRWLFFFFFSLPVKLAWQS